eukprot:scaffold7346_cov245-Pinguiococcus_pyrenoidosus.AAC.34
MRAHTPPCPLLISGSRHRKSAPNRLPNWPAAHLHSISCRKRTHHSCGSTTAPRSPLAQAHRKKGVARMASPMRSASAPFALALLALSPALPAGPVSGREVACAALPSFSWRTANGGMSCVTDWNMKIPIAAFLTAWARASRSSATSAPCPPPSRPLPKWDCSGGTSDRYLSATALTSATSDKGEFLRLER